MKLTGRIWRARSGFAFARTPVGMLTLFSKEGLRQVKAGQWATVWTHGRNIVVDIFNKGEPTPRHRFITAVPVSGLWIAGSDHPDALDARGRHAR